LIADHVIQVADDDLSRLLFGFEADSNTCSAETQPICRLNRAPQECIHGVGYLTPDHEIIHVMSLDRDHTAIIMADRDFRNASIRSLVPNRRLETMLPPVYSRLAYYSTIFVHGALIDIPDYGGVMFIGDSGVGKTTLAELWQTHRGAEILNGDKVFLGLREDAPGQVLAYGNPWNGSSPYRVNRRVPLKAIVTLKRSPRKYVRPLDELEATFAYTPRVFMPTWDVALTEKVMETLGEMMPMVPVYEMSCNPDESAVIMLEQVLFKQPE
jgi:hypothetical protein